MKISIVASAILFTAAASTAMASTVAEREYQRGYDDCSQGRYDQNQHGESYKKGCRAAEDHQKSGAPSAKQAPATTKPASKAKISDLKGMDSIKAFDVMTSRGFTSVDTLSSGDTIYGIYYNAKTHQCVQLANANDRVDSAVDIHEHPKCR
jgi:type II secretory pathway pseudopilin PulG